MGGGSSSVANKKISFKQSTDVIARNIMSCSSGNVVTQSFRIVGNGNIVNGFKQVQYMKLSNNCEITAQNLNDIKSAVSNDLKSEANNSSAGLFSALGKSASEVNTDIDNEVNTKITNETITTIVNNTNQQQEAVITGDNNIVNNFEQSQTVDMLNSNIQKTLNKLDSAVQISNVAEDKQTNSNDPFKFISDIFSSLTTGYLGIVIIIAIIVLGGAYMGRETIFKLLGIGTSVSPILAPAPVYSPPVYMPSASQ
jgi:hypothetical protein